jgi:hypothetical protein
VLDHVDYDLVTLVEPPGTDGSAGD